jgi:hypothetical protein
MNRDRLLVPTTTRRKAARKFRAATRWSVIGWAAAILLGTLPAQDPPAATSREETYAARQTEKARESTPPSRNTAERVVRKAELLFLLDPSGFFPAFEGVYQGGGLTLGGGYRSFYGDNTFWQVKGLYSVLNYKLIEGATVSKDRLKGKLTLGTRVGWRDATQVAYYGIGLQSKPEDRGDFRFQQTYVDGDAVFRPRKWLPIKGSLAYEHWNTLKGQGGHPSIETRYNAQTAPGLGAEPSYVHTELSAGIDWRQSPGYTRRGGLYEVTLDDYRNAGGPYSFQKLTAEVIQHVPLLRETWVLAARGRMETSLNDNDLIPYFLLPSLGSGSTLRAYSSYRFRDRHSLLFNAEFRWIPAVGLDMALFYDAGKVAARRDQLDFKGMKSDVGIGARFHGPFATPIRIDLAVGNEGWRLVLSGGPIF